ncbi:MAG TPA: hypothetical protein VF600_15255 [Abditibacteriaceae bacterium]|jgi:hypothetical protein
MANQANEIRKALEAGEYKELFIEVLGWDKNDGHEAIPLDGQSYPLRGLGKKWNFLAFGVDCGAEIPDSKTLSKLAREVAKRTPENIVLYHTSDGAQQVWQWARREPGKPVALRHYRVLKGGNNALLIEKIEALTVSLDDEEKARREGRDTVYAMSGTVRAAFDVEKVTKKFYERFSKEHAAFLSFIKGIPDAEMQSWYASVMLNRLMFIYFVQHKGFLYLDGRVDKEYLVHQLQRAKKEQRPFYRGFLRPLFERAFATPQNARTQADNDLFGRVPYLNGGLFTTHQIERDHDSIEISDKAFEKIFEFFDDYDWHLDDNPLREGREINPDVLGYIFEKYINQKQMGAYYTKEDITGYIARNTILPFWLERAREALPQAFAGESSVWNLLRDNPDKYIYPAVRHGLRDENGELRSLPEHIARGLNDVSQRGDWNKPAPSDWALPTEIWREVVARRQKYIEVYEKCRGGVFPPAPPVSPPSLPHKDTRQEDGGASRGRGNPAPTVNSVDDLITLNLDIVQFCEDVVSLWADESLLRELWKALAGNQNRTRKSNEEASNGISVLDPTCGSGAFLFAAINILEPLYSACLDRMTGFVAEADAKKLKQKNVDFREILARVDDRAHHPNREYFVLKNILVNNLFGVDIMEEAVEICKLRLFLKLASCVEPDATQENFGIEPLPDIDFNIRAGNTLVGYATTEDLQRAFSAKLSFDDTLQQIEKQAQDIESAFDLFRQCQTQNRDSELPEAKRVLRTRLETLRDQLDVALAEQYEIGKSKKSKEFGAWRESHKPFHWFIEFYGILKRGGFDCVIGNPPYVEYSKVRNEYSIKGFETESCGNLYAFVLERHFAVLRANGWSGLIVLLAVFGTRRMRPIQHLYKKHCKAIFASHYEGTSHPSVIFNGVEAQLSILIAHREQILQDYECWSTNYTRTYSVQRPTLFARISYTTIDHRLWDGALPRFYTDLEKQIWRKMLTNSPTLLQGQETLLIRTMGNFFWRLAFVKEPLFEINGVQSRSSTTSEMSVAKPRRAVQAIIFSSLFYWYWGCFSDVYHLTKSDLQNFPFDITKATPEQLNQMGHRAKDVERKLFDTAKIGDYERKNGRYVFNRFFPHESKPIIDEIDRVLAAHYGFTDEELDFIINYDIKYRMGRSDDAE